MHLLRNLRRLTLLGGAFFVCGLPLPALAQNIMRAPVVSVEAGIICDYLPSGQITDAPDTSAGIVRRGGTPPDFDIQTTIVPARRGLAFGLRVLLSDDVGMTPVTMVTRHPPFGAEHKIEERWSSSILGGSPNTRLFYFEFDYEMVPGDWWLEVHAEGTILVSHKFTVVPERAAVDLLSGCPAPNLTS